MDDDPHSQREAPREDRASDRPLGVTYRHVLREQYEKLQARPPDRFNEMMRRLWDSHQPEPGRDR